MITILIGANDLCASCVNDSIHTPPDKFELYLRNTLESIRTKIPRTFVNLVEIFNISQVFNLSQSYPHCQEVKRVFFWECDCLFNENNGAAKRLEMDTIAQLYNERIRKISVDYQSRNYTDFAVVDHPIGRNTALAKFPIDFLSTLDCFHPSLVAHQLMGAALWNSILTPNAKKLTSLPPVAPDLICPTKDTLMYTS